TPVQEMAKVGIQLQKQYDHNREQLDFLGSTLQNSPVLSQDRPLLEKEMSSVREGLAKAASSGNYEDMSNTVRTLSRQFTERYVPFSRNYKLYQDKLKAIDENKDITGETKELLKREATMYGGLQKDKDG